MRARGELKKISVIPQIILLCVLAVLLLMVFFPLIMTLIKSVKTPTQDTYKPFELTFPFCWENYSIAWLYVSPLISNSLFIAIMDTIGSLILASVTAYGFTRFKFPGREIIFMAIISLMMIPGSLTMIPKYIMIRDFGLINKYFGVILPGMIAGLPFRLLLLRTFFNGVPNDLFEAAEIDGANHLHQFFHIMIPMCIPILATICMNNFLQSWNELLWPRLILLDENLQTIPIGLASFTQNYQTITGGTMGAPLAGYIIVSIPLVILFAFTSKQFVRGLTSGAFKM